ncbi:MAG: NAD(P)-dependent oxidoreductase [Nocardioidaceae bacterium]
MSAVAVLGSGAMGSRIAVRLLERGHRVTVWNRTQATSEPVVASGARAVATPAEAAADSDFVLTVLRDESAVADVIGSADGVAGGITSRSMLIDLTTVGPEFARERAQLVPDAIAVLEAPMVGSRAEAVAGELRLLVGGDTENVREAWQLLSDLGTPTHVGNLGAGAVGKLLVNASLFAVVTALGECAAFAAAAGWSEATTFEVLGLGALAEQAARRRSAMSERAFPPRFALDLAAKDARLIRNSLPAGLHDGVLEAACQWLERAEQAGWAESDYTAVLEHIQRDANDGRQDDPAPSAV